MYYSKYIYDVNMKYISIKICVVITALFGLVVSANASRSCSITDFQSCSSCVELSEAIDITQPNAGEYYRGAYWNGLLMAYVRDCPNIGQLLLDNGASPVTGGNEGLLIYAVTNKWPHDDEVINSKWVNLLLKNGAAMDMPIEYDPQRTTTQTLNSRRNEGLPMNIDYPHLLKKFTGEYGWIITFYCEIGYDSGYLTSVVNCFAPGLSGNTETTIELTTGGRKMIIGTYEFYKFGTETRDGGLSFEATKTFSLKAQNNGNGLNLRVKITDESSGTVVYEDVQAQYGVINVGN